MDCTMVTKNLIVCMDSLADGRGTAQAGIGDDADDPEHNHEEQDKSDGAYSAPH